MFYRIQYFSLDGNGHRHKNIFLSVKVYLNIQHTLSNPSCIENVMTDTEWCFPSIYFFGSSVFLCFSVRGQSIFLAAGLTVVPPLCFPSPPSWNVLVIFSSFPFFPCTKNRWRGWHFPRQRTTVVTSEIPQCDWSLCATSRIWPDPAIHITPWTTVSITVALAPWWCEADIFFIQRVNPDLIFLLLPCAGLNPSVNPWVCTLTPRPFPLGQAVNPELLISGSAGQQQRWLH